LNPGPRDIILAMDDDHKPIRIALVYGSGVGRNTFKEYFAQRYGCFALGFTDPLYAVVEQMQFVCRQPRQVDPELMHELEFICLLRYGPGLFIDIINERVPYITRSNTIVMDVKRHTEMDYLRKEGFVMVRITREGTKQEQHELDDTDVDHVISNNGTIEELHEKIDALVESLAG